MYKVFAGANNSSNSSKCLPRNGVSQIQVKNYTNVLKAVHENIVDFIDLG